MSSVIRNTYKQFSYPKYVYVNDYIKYIIPSITSQTINPATKSYLTKYFSFPTNEMKETMNEEAIIELQEKTKHIYDYRPFTQKQHSKTQIELIDQYLQEHAKYPDRLRYDISNYTYFEWNFTLWNITNICRKYDITGDHIFVSLLRDRSYKSRIINYLTLGFDVHYNVLFHHIYEKRMKEIEYSYTKENKYIDLYLKNHKEYITFDTIYKVPIKNKFPYDIYNDKTPFVLNMIEYNKINNEGFERVLSCIESFYDNDMYNDTNYKHTCYNKYDPFKTIENSENKEKNEKNENTENNEINEINKQLFEPKTFNHLIKDVSNKDKQQHFMNHRKDGWTLYKLKSENKSLWSYMMKPIYDLYIRDKYNPNYKAYNLNLENYFTLRRDMSVPFKEESKNINDYDLEIAYNVRINKLFISNILMFGDKRITREHLELLLSFIRMKEDYQNDIVYLDNYEIDLKTRQNDERHYFITYKTEKNHLDKLEFCKTTYEKMRAAKHLILLMNEIPPELLNHHNYEMIYQYYRKYQYISERIDNLIKLDERLKDLSDYIQNKKD